MHKSGGVLACLGLLVLFLAAEALPFRSLLQKHQLSRPHRVLNTGLEALSLSQLRLPSGKSNTGNDLGMYLMVAVNSNNLALVKLYLSYGADPNYVYDSGDGKFTPLMLAAAKCYVPIMSALLEGGAGPDYEVDDTHPMEVALLFKCYPGVKVLIQGGADPDDYVFESVVGNDSEGLQALIDGGGDVNLVREGYSLIFVAAFLGSEECIEVLVDNGAEKDNSGSQRATPKEVVCLCTKVSKPSDVCYRDKCNSQGINRMKALLSPTKKYMWSF